MGTLPRVPVTALLVLVGGLAADPVVAQMPRAVTSSSEEPPEKILQIATATTGTIAGIVLDERGQPLEGVVVSAMGASTSFAVSDPAGQYTLRALMPGPYLVRADRDGYLSARNTMVNVRPSARTVSTFTLRREGKDGEPRLVEAGLGVSDETGTAGPRDEGEVSWRLRHLKRSILRESTALAGLPADEEWFITDSLQFLGRAVGSSARAAGALFTQAPLEGEVNLLTTGAFDAPGDLLKTDRTQGVAFFVVGAPVGEHGDWTVKAALNQGDLSAWLLTGNYVARHPGAHRYHLGMSYGLHRYEGGNPAALAAVTESARNVGSVYAHDEWTLSPRLTVGYGGHFAHYDYLLDSTHFSPRVSATVQATDRTRIRAVASRRVSAPGAEEFLPPARAQVLPPQRTFAPLSRTGFVPEDTRHYEVGVERVLDGATIGVRAFQQTIDDQLVTIFGLRSADVVAADIGHYTVGSSGQVGVRGWGVTLTHALARHLRGSVDYSLADAQWANQRTADRFRLSRSVPGALRPDSERVHDLTTTVETELPLSATRVFVLYKINNGFVRSVDTESRPGFDGRWDVQVSQGLPFLNFTAAEWEMLIAVRNLFRDSFAESSIYDELLVVRPPKRLVGGITVKF